MTQWIIHTVEFIGEKKNVKKLMKKLFNLSNQHYTNVVGGDLVPKKNINPKLFGVIQSYLFDGVAFIAEEPLLDELKEIANYYKVNFELQYNCWNAFNFGRMDYFYKTQTENSILFNENDLKDIEFDEENQVYKYEGAEFSHRSKLEKYIFDRAVRVKQIEMILEQLD